MTACATGRSWRGAGIARKLALGSAGLLAAALTGLPAAQAQDRQTLWEFWRTYSGPDKLTRLLRSYAVGVVGGCTGTMIAPHILLTAAHCGGPGFTGKSVQFFHTDEEAPGPAPQYQALSAPYFAYSFPWQRFVNATGTQDGDFMLWWVADGTDGLPPGIKYGQVELSTGAVSVGQKAYSFWQNPYPWVDPSNPSNQVSFTTLYHSVGEATTLGDGLPGHGPLHFTDYSIAAVPGASGSSVISASTQAIIGTTAIADGASRRAGDTSFVLSLHDSDANAVLDPVEHDLLTTGRSADFRLLSFDSPLARAQWRPAFGTNGQVTLASPRLQGVPAGSQPQTWVGHIGGARIGPIRYRACWNSPWNTEVNGHCPARNGFFLEDFEDGLLNVTGVTASAGAVLGPGAGTDSVDLDDGAGDGNGNAGHSFFSASGSAGITFRFDQAVLGLLPKRVGVVWTDGDGETSFEAFDAQGGSLGTIGPIAIADSSHAGTDADDRFFGFTHQGGISAVRISNTQGGIEIDHLQYETNNLPSNGDSLGHANARFAANATYRITAVVYGLSSNNNAGTIAFTSASGGLRQVMTFQTAFGGWKRVTGRVTLGNKDDYRLILGAPNGSSFYVSSIAILREAGDASLNFQTAEERASWEYTGGSHPTSWGIGGAGDFSGVVSGGPAVVPWHLRQRNVALEANARYEISYDVKHVRGSLGATHHMRVENLSAVAVAGHTWQFTQNGQLLRRSIQVNTGNESGNALVFGTNGAVTYLVDNIRIRRM